MNPIVLRFATLFLMVVVPGYKVVTLEMRLRHHRRDGREEIPWGIRAALEAFEPHHYTPEGLPIFHRLQAWRKVQLGATVLACITFLVWETIDPVLT